MKKFFMLAASAMFALCMTSCGEDPTVGTGEGEGEGTVVSGVVLNELSGEQKYIELYNTTDAEVSLEGLMLVKYDSSKEGGSSITWNGAAGMKIAAKGYVVLESSDLADTAEGGDPAYKYESKNHIFKGGLSGKKNVKIELQAADGSVLDTFQRGEEGAGWNQVKGYKELPEYSFSRIPDGTGDWACADHTKKTANGEKKADMTNAPEM